MTDTTEKAVVETAAGAAPPAPAPPPRTARVWRGVTPWLFLIAPLALLITFTYAPVANMLAYSLTDWDGVSPELRYTGAENYAEIFTREDLFRVFFVSGYYLAASAVQIVAALYFATILSFNVRFRNFFKGVLFFPYLINGVAIGFVFLYFFQDGGTLDSVLNLFGVETEHAWLGTPVSANTSLAGVSVWRYLGLNFVLFLGAIQSIPGELYEAAELDGANRWHQFRYIIAPGIKPVLTLTVILSISGSLSVFEVPYIMTGGATGTETFVIQTVNLAFRFGKTGLASAAAVVLLLIILLVTWIQRRLVPDDKVDLV
ncbi:carbohydrate ABC transporter permease [Streptomyces sp. YU58]|uniref:carbohydrate ABC transporter permease n=1 Tax=Streptomyces sp. SX92 TaxID=3158972 RepID=UPI0027BA545B|nr:sugar ABC transporter permease [Streptomyces coralus]WLW51553.1 sugar ABC transporter permease [Streptomyces coralus]